MIGLRANFDKLLSEQVDSSGLRPDPVSPNANPSNAAPNSLSHCQWHKTTFGKKLTSHENPRTHRQIEAP